ncbi:HAMP domain-containing protein [Oleisolibacter albus]|uniref:HAMP domain-containing protein n=1 Tax=Oleisolibacter albus TaxID=2171757 RepID=UPI000DF36133|nr:HAMP domain-containing protein [Oleisolibacter albus]
MDTGSRLSSVRGICAAIAVSATLVVGGLAGAAAFHWAWLERVKTSQQELPADTEAKNRLLDEVQTALGHSGFLQNLALQAETGSADARRDMQTNLETADKALRALEAKRLTPAESQLAGEIKRLLDGYRKALAAAGDRPQPLDGASGFALLAGHAALADRIAAFHLGQSQMDVGRFEQLALRGFWLGLGAVGALVALLAAVLLLIGTRVLRPLHELTASTAGLAKGDWRAPVWGIGRADEFGTLARAVDGFRKVASEVPDISVMTDDGRMRLKFEGDYADLFEALTARLRGAGGTLSVLGADVGRMVSDTKTQLTDTLGQVNALCTAAVRTVNESNREIRQSTEMLAHAVAQVKAFDDRSPGGGLDGLIATLKGHADTLAATLSTAGEEVTATMASLASSDGGMRHASAQAREAAQQLMSSMAEAQQHLLTAAKLMRASGDLLSTSAEQTGGRLIRAAEAVEAGEHALVAALGEATARLDTATEQASARLEDAGHQVARAADLLDDRSRDISANLDSTLDEMRQAKSVMEASADIASQRLEPLAERFEQVQDGLSTLVGDVAARAGEMAEAAETVREAGDGLRAEFDRRRIEPDTQEAMADMLARLRGSAAQIQERVQEIGGTAQRLAQTLASGVDDATARLRDATGELRLETRQLANQAGEATGTLSRTAARQDQLVEQLRALADALEQRRTQESDTGDLAGLAAGLSAATDAVHALIASSDRQGAEAVRDAVALVQSLKDRIDSIEGAAAGLGAATEAVHALIASGEERRGVDELASIAEALKQRLEGIERLGERLDGSASSIRSLLDSNRQRESLDLTVIAELAQSLRERVLRMDGLTVDLSRAIEGLKSSSRQGEAAQSQATRELGNRLAQIAEQLRATATGVQTLTGGSSAA